MAAVFTLWVASCATLYAQLNDSGKTLSSVLEAFPDEAPLVQASVVASAVCGALLLIKVDGKPIQKGSLQLVVHGQACFYTWWAQLRDASPIVPYATVGWFPLFAGTRQQRTCCVPGMLTCGWRWNTAFMICIHSLPLPEDPTGTFLFFPLPQFCL